MTDRDFAIDVVKRLRDAGFQALWAGGCVRDELLGIVPTDYDVATNARPDQVKRLFRRTVQIGAMFGVIQVMGPRKDLQSVKVEVATFRADGNYSDGRHPDSVEFATAREDALRRDFTINGMFYDPIGSELIDYVDGQKDLEARILRAIGDPAARFSEDKLRLLRAVRFASRFQLDLESATLTALIDMAPQIQGVSAERIAEELRRLLVDPQRVAGVDLLYRTGIATQIMPELSEMKGLPQGPPDSPTGDLWDHVLKVLNLLGPAPTFPLALAALLHDVGKRRTVGRTPDRYTFYYHEDVGRRMAGDVCLRLKMSTSERERVAWLVKKHQILCDAENMRISKLKQILSHPGIEELLILHRADAVASKRSTAHVEFCENLRKKWSNADLNPEPLLTGNDLKQIGLKPGPLFKHLLDAVYESQLDGALQTKEQALELIHRLLAERQHTNDDEGTH